MVTYAYHWFLFFTSGQISKTGAQALINLERNNLITPAIAVLTLGALASVCIVITAFSLSRKIILSSMLLTNILTGAQFILLNQTATTYLIGVSLVYSILLIIEKKIPFVRTHAFTGGLLLVQMVGYFLINGFSWNWGLLALTGTIIGTLAMWFQNPLKLKVTMLFMGFIWLSYQTAAGAYGQLPGEFVFIAGVITSLVLLTKAQKKGIPLDEVEELPTLIRRKIAERKSLNKTEPAYS